ncbi:YdcF family protein [Entomobacter blattae]|uniref:DUF218 domain-containing protein n=1 Tax=Entomobacter blattae TaxID=2762277 RepID=A0A7H1NUY3_9PROT|nr:YdcF family protein [Entomobacter blattae]QNT79593.1 hypothetical protein JGUZn3_23930 [Entomobacter blattae]
MVLGGMTLAWLVGFTWFFADSQKMRPLPPFPVDGIVVLTGGPNRIETALYLLKKNKAKYLLISGVNQETTLDELQRLIPAEISPALRQRIVLGHHALTTLGNAAETTSWVQANDMKSLIVVTAGYHIRRAMTEMRAVLPQTALYPYSINSPIMKQPYTSHALYLYMREYMKFIVAYLGLTRTYSLLFHTHPSLS